MKIYFIRHGLTAGNLEKRYIGITDEPLCESGIKQLENIKYPECEVIISSPMKRCIQTAEIIYPNREYYIYNEFCECNFGDFEGKNYLELSENHDYQKWIESNGRMTFPNGENPDEFRRRCTEGFLKAVERFSESDSIAMIVHGGTIMSIMERYAVPQKDYYDWQIKNGHILFCDYDRKIIKVLEKL